MRAGEWRTISVGAKLSVTVGGDKLMRVRWHQPYGIEELTLFKAASKPAA